jgi:uncharacterized delta-60 repeat protein
MEERCLLSAGALDPTFGSGGTASPAATVNRSADAAAVYGATPPKTAGDIVVAGNIQQTSGDLDFAVVRYKPNGTPDSTFGKAGEVTTSFGKSYGYSYATDVAIQADGKIVAGGFAYGSTIKRSSYDFVLVRYNVNGSLDSSFGAGGIVTTNFGGGTTYRTGSFDLARAELIQPDGKIVLAGLTVGATDTVGKDSNIALARYNADGTLDTTFGSDGKVSTSHDLIPGSFVDPAYGVTQVYDTALQSDGKILVAGFTQVTGGQSPSFEAFVARYNADGTLDTSFGASGFVTLPAVNAGSITLPAGYLAVEPGGEIVVTGIHQLALLHSGQAGYADGSFDTTFGVSQTGIVPYGFGALALEPGGDIVVNDYTSVNGAATPKIVRFLSDGTVDATFGAGGSVIPAHGFALSPAIAIQPDGKIDLAGIGFKVERLLPGAPQIGLLTASANPVSVGSTLNLVASQIADVNPGASISRVAFYQDSNGDGTLDPATDTLLGQGVQTSTGVWTLDFTVPSTWTPGAYTLFAQAKDSFGVLGDPVAITELIS